MQNLNITHEDIGTIVNALSVAAAEYDRLSLIDELPPQLRDQFAYQGRQARKLEERLRDDEGF